MIMNGVEVDIPSTTNAAHIPIMPVDEHVVSSSEIGMADLSGVRMDEDMGLEVKPEEDMDKLKERLRHQLEYYFSNQNLAKDDYLKYQMDEQQYVPIRTIATFNLVQKLTTDIDLITEVLKSSTLVEVDEKREKVRQSQTNIAALILREIPEDTPVESVKGLFDGDDCPKFLSCQFAANTSWYVTFESENDAQEAYRHLRERVKNFLGKPIMARIKSKTQYMSTLHSKGPQPQSAIPGQIMNPPYVSPAVFPASAAGTPFGPGAQGAPYIAAIPTQPPPPGTTSPLSSTVSTAAPPPQQVYVVPGSNGQAWYPDVFANHGFPPNGVFPAHIPPGSYVPHKRGGYHGKGNVVGSNYMTGDYPPGRGVTPDGRFVHLQVNTQVSEGRRYVQTMPMAAQQNLYPTTLMAGQQFYKSQPSYNKHNRSNGSIPNGAGYRYGNRNHYDNDISPRFQKKGIPHPRYSASRNQQHDYTSRSNSDGGHHYSNGPISVHDSYPAAYQARSNGADAIANNGARFGNRTGFNNSKFDATDGQAGSGTLSDINNNASKGQNFNDTVQNAAFDYRTGMASKRLPRHRRNGDSRSSSARPSPPPAPVGNGADQYPVETFNLEQTSFPPLPGAAAAASNAGPNPITAPAEVSVKKPPVTESYKNSLKMNLEPAALTMPNLPPTQTFPVSPHPVNEKEQTMQPEHREPATKTECPVEKKPAGPPPANAPAKPALKSSKTPDQRRPAAPPPAEKRNTEKAEKPAKSQQKQSKGNSDSPQKTVAEPSKGSANEKNTVPTADTDAGKKLSYAEMLRKKTAGRPAAMSETDKTEPGTDTAAAEEAPAAEPRPQQTQKHPEAPAVNGEAGQDEKSAPSDDSEGDEKPWESAGPNKRSHRGDRDHGGPHPSSRGRGGRGRGRGRGGYGRGGGRYGSGRDKVNGFNNDRQTLGAGDAAQRKR